MYVDLRPWNTRTVRVLIAGEWITGELEAWRRRGGRWEGWVRTIHGIGSQRLGWYDAAALEPADS